MQNPTVPPPGEQWPSDPPPTPKQDHAVLAWLALEADLSDAVQLHLLDALADRVPLMETHLFPTEPEAGIVCDLLVQRDLVDQGRIDSLLAAALPHRLET